MSFCAENLLYVVLKEPAMRLRRTHVDASVDVDAKALVDVPCILFCSGDKAPQARRWDSTDFV